MRAYLNGIVVTVVVCQIVTMFSPSRDDVRRYVRLICVLVTLLTLASPVKYVINASDDIFAKITDFFDGAESGDQLDDLENGNMASAALVIMRAISDEFDIDAKNIRITLVTDEAGELSEMQLFLKNTAYADRERVRAALEEEFDIPIYVFAER